MSSAGRLRVLAAMSGGVDSAVAAARLLDAGHEVTGVHLALSRHPERFGADARGCCSLEDSHDARRAADLLGIPFYVWDLSEEFATDVVADFLAQYAAGRTPNPCLRCNEKIKFEAVLNRGVALGFDAVATGHYARVRSAGGRVELWRAADGAKDQSYVLGVLNQEQLRRSLFPLGDAAAKADVRAEAAARGLSVAAKPDSTDICFIPGGDTAGYLRAALGERPGEIVDCDGRVVGAHLGAHQFTVGQRHGLRLGVPAKDGRPRYVVAVDAAANRVVVGPREALMVGGFLGTHVTWADEPVPGPWPGLAQWRAHARPEPAVFAFDGERLTVTLDRPARGIAPGQTIVCYDGERVVGSSTIAETWRPGKASPTFDGRLTW